MSHPDPTREYGEHPEEREHKAWLKMNGHSVKPKMTRSSYVKEHGAKTKEALALSDSIVKKMAKKMGKQKTLKASHNKWMER